MRAVIKMSSVQNIGNRGDKGAAQKETKSKVDDKHFTLEIPGYEIQEQCGDGGTAKVYVALQNSLDRKVALKIMLAALSIEEEHTDRFIKEGRVIAKLSHPNIVTIYDVGVFEEHHYIAMEHLPCGSLREKLHKKLDLEWSIKVVQQIASALTFAHENGFIHRDIKPENILFRNDNTAVLSDFGIAKVCDARTQVTSRGSLGTPRYMSPDQIRSAPITPSSDVYSLGVVLFEMLTGKPPFDNEDGVSILYSHVHDPIPALPLESRHLQALLNKMLAKNTNDRFNNAAEVVEVLSFLIKEKRLPAELHMQQTNALGVNQKTILVDQQTIDEIGTSHKVKDVEAIKISDEKENNANNASDIKQHTVQVTSDELASAISTQARLESFNNKTKAKKNTHQEEVALKATKNLLNLNEAKPKTYQGLTSIVSFLNDKRKVISTSSFYNKLNSNNMWKGFSNPGVLSAILAVIALAFFTMYINGNDESTQTLADNSKQTNSETAQVHANKIAPEATNNRLIDSKTINSDKSNSENIKHWLSQAELLIKEGKLIAPVENNALTLYQQVLVIDPKHNIALQGMQNIINHFNEQTNVNVVADNNDEVKRELLGKLLSVEEISKQLNVSSKANVTELLVIGQNHVITESAETAKTDTIEITEITAAKNELLPAQNTKELHEPLLLASANESVTGIIDTKQELNINTAKKISELIILAESYLEKDYLMLPKENNAFSVFQKIKKLDPNHPSFDEGMAKIANQYALAAERRFAVGEVERAKSLVNRGLKAQPNHNWLNTLRIELSHYVN